MAPAASTCSPLSPDSPLSPFQMTSSYTTTTTITEAPSRKLQNGDAKSPLDLTKNPLYSGEDIRPEMRDDIHDPSYKDQEGPRPKLVYVWRNIILMSLLHLGALYGITLVPTCKVYTWLWGKSFSCPVDPGPQILSTL